MILLLQLILLFSSCAQPSPAQQALTIEVSSNENAVIINGKKIAFDRAGIISALGKPSRTEELKRMERYEEYGGPNGNTSDMVEVVDHFLIYDDLGLVFRTRNGFMDRSTDPGVMLVYTANKRSFDNSIICEKEPKGKFTGTIMINGEKLPLEKAFIPADVNYKTEAVALFRRNFSVTSYAAQVDGIYSHSTPGIAIHLDNSVDRKASVIEIGKPSE